MNKGIRLGGLVILFWGVVSLIFYINDLPSDGTKTYGIPYKIVEVYWSRKENVAYDFVVSYWNLFFDLLFICGVTLFYYFLFRNIRRNKG